MIDEDEAAKQVAEDAGDAELEAATEGVVESDLAADDPED
mgnify:CR=1 FL=1